MNTPQPLKIFKIPLIFFLFLVVIHIYLPRIIIKKIVSLVRIQKAEKEKPFEREFKTVSLEFEEFKKLTQLTPTPQPTKWEKFESYFVERKYVPKIFVLGEELNKALIIKYADLKIFLNRHFYHFFWGNLPFMPLDRHNTGLTLIERGSDPHFFLTPAFFNDENMASMNAQIDFFDQIASQLSSQNIFIYNIIVPKFSSIYQDLNPHASYKYIHQDVLAEFKKKLNTRITYAQFDYSYEEFKEYFFKTDHHWTVKGAFEAYKKIMLMIQAKSNIEMQLLKLTNCFDVEGVAFHGSYAKTSGLSQYHDKLTDCTFELPDYSIKFNGELPLRRNDRDLIFKRKADIFENYYGVYFGNDYGFLRYESVSKERNLLMFVDSYSNCVEHLFTAHYKNVYLIDRRFYEKDMGEELNLAQFVLDHKIDDVVFMLDVRRILFRDNNAAMLEVVE
jgi:hypothetical protein